MSLGLVAVAIIHAVQLGTVFTALRPCPTVQPEDDAWSVPNAVLPAPRVGGIEKLDEPQSVNLSAQGEIKQQSVSICPTCEPTTIYTPTIAPQPVVPVAASLPQPSKKKYQIALFIGSDAKSKQLLDWFNHDPKLFKLRTDSGFQVYTSGNTVYQTRFASIVPVEQFPVVLLQDNTVGHVHARVLP